MPNEITMRGLGNFLARRWERKAKAQHMTIGRVRENIVYPWELESDRVETTNNERD